MSGGRSVLAPRWDARVAVAAGIGAIVVLLFAGLDSLLLLLLGAAGPAVTAGGVWWVLVHTGLVKGLAGVLACAASAAVIVLYTASGLLRAVLVPLALRALAVFCGRIALAGAEATPARAPQRPLVPPQRPYLIMNPRSGGDKVGRFRLREKAEALGAEVCVLDVSRRQDVAALARRAADAGADLLGVAGGDGTQALVAAVAAERDLRGGTGATRRSVSTHSPTASSSASTWVSSTTGYSSTTRRSAPTPPSCGALVTVTTRSAPSCGCCPICWRTGTARAWGVRAGGVTVEQPQAVLVSNNPYRTYDPAGLGRREQLDSGVLGVLSVEVDSAAQAARVLCGPGAPGLAQLTAREVVIEADADAIPVGVVGEALNLSAPVRCRTRLGSLRVRVPRDRPGVPRGRPSMDWHRVRRLGLTAIRKAEGHEK